MFAATCGRSSCNDARTHAHARTHTHIHTHTITSSHIHTFTHTQRHTQSLSHTRTYIHKHTHTHAHTRGRARAHTHTNKRNHREPLLSQKWNHQAMRWKQPKKNYTKITHIFLESRRLTCMLMHTHNIKSEAATDLRRICRAMERDPKLAVCGRSHNVGV